MLPFLQFLTNLFKYTNHLKFNTNLCRALLTNKTHFQTDHQCKCFCPILQYEHQSHTLITQLPFYQSNIHKILRTIHFFEIERPTFMVSLT